MAEDNDFSLDLDLEEEPNINNRAEERIRTLSSKVRTQAQETATERKAREEAETRASEAEKRAEFLEEFSGLTTKYPAATEHRDAIRDKVMAGYSVEDATVAVLNSENKLVPQPVEEAPIASETSFGGSAATPPLSGESKDINEMTQEERRNLLVEADRRGELRQILERKG